MELISFFSPLFWSAERVRQQLSLALKDHLRIALHVPLFLSFFLSDRRNSGDLCERRDSAMKGSNTVSMLNKNGGG